MIGPFVFLDIDGVLNGHERHENGYCGCNEDSVNRLNCIIVATKTKIIVSSAWRYFVLRGEMTIAGLNGCLATHGLLPYSIVDVLGPDIPDGNGGADRGKAILQWFGAKYGIAHPVKYVAIDDMDLGYTRHGIPFVQTHPSIGLDPDHILAVIKALK